MLEKIKRIPAYGWILGIIYFALQYGMYRLGDFLSDLIGTKANAWCPKIPFIDDLFPVISVFAVIYIFSYIFWIFGPIAVSLTKKSHFLNYIIGLSIAYVIGFLIFTFLPTYMDRVQEGLLNFEGTGIFNNMLSMIYKADGAEIAFNLFPSYHCLISTYCYLGVRKQPEISKGFKIYSLVMAILICLSTLFTKQHYILDSIGGITIAVLSYILVEKWNPGNKLTK